MVQGRQSRYGSKNPYTDRKDFKAREIKKSLTQRARLRKNYFKLIENEGDSSREDTRNPTEGGDAGESRHQRHTHVNPERKQLNFAERTRIAKERKEEKRREKLEALQERRRQLEKKQKERENHKAKLSQRTKTGQPLMAPRINDMLEKIRKDIG